MNLFELLRTAFKVVASAITQNTLFIIGLTCLFFMIVWSVLSLTINSSVKFSRNSKRIIRFLRENSLTKENYAVFIDLFKNMPPEMRFAWKRYENKKEGVAGDYINRSDCFDAPIMGGIQKQNRSLMRTAIYFIFGVLTLFSIAIIGATSVKMSNAVLTTTMLAEAMIVPSIILVLLMVNYYIYTNIRNQEYRTASDFYLDLVDALNDRVDLNSIFGQDTRTIGLISSVYINETIEHLNTEARQRKKNKEVAEVRVGKRNSINPLNAGVLGSDSTFNLSDNVVSTTTDMVSNKLSTPENDIALDTSLDSNFKIKNEVHFVEVVNCVEVLLTRVETESNPVKKQAIEREVNTLIKALTEYKQKAKKQSRKSKTETK